MHETIKQAENKRQREYFASAGFLILFIVIVGIAAVLLETEYIQWPFRRQACVLDTYKNVLVYLPMLVFAFLSMGWLKVAETPIWDVFYWKKPSISFYLALSVSAGYSIYLFVTCRFDLKGVGFWPPVVILSLFNSVAEEIIYRHVIMGLTKKIVGHSFLPNLIQSLFYGLVHIPIGGIRLGIYAFCYGLLLGWVMQKNQNLIPCILSHFCIDIGNIGLPLLVLLP
ncbi:MAG: hypothetical protein C0403_14620 [Desulfobacterium sp.]|nr:hypothetical protein [Desulfobacterium sp.]